jgi:hypothetical protein
MKKLYNIISDNGDGSQCINWTFDYSLVDELLQQQENNIMSDYWQSGDGLQWSWLNVPDECTYESLGIHAMNKEEL